MACVSNLARVVCMVVPPRNIGFRILPSTVVRSLAMTTHVVLLSLAYMVCVEERAWVLPPTVDGSDTVQCVVSPYFGLQLCRLHRVRAQRSLDFFSLA